MTAHEIESLIFGLILAGVRAWAIVCSMSSAIVIRVPR